ncbi:MAG: hypothetical protein AAF081_00640 [Actinomycetota bacterium]
MSQEPEQTIDRLAHAFDPSGWKRRNLVIASVAFPVVLAVTVLQRALVSDNTAEWTITAVHGLICAVIVPLLLRYTWREWRAANDAAPGS